MQFAPRTYRAAKARPPSARAVRDEQLKIHIHIVRVHAANYDVYGAPKVWAQRNREGIRVARCTVERLMRDLGLRGAGGAVARALAREGAQLFLTGRRRAPVEAVAKDIVAAGGSAEAAEVDALDEHAVDEHLQSVVDTAGRVDISFNAVGIPDTKILGVPMVELDVEQFCLPIATYTRSYFLTPHGGPTDGRDQVGGDRDRHLTAVADGRPSGGRLRSRAGRQGGTHPDLSAELAPHGIRVVGLRPQAMPEADTLREAFEPRAKATGMTWEQFQEFLAGRTHPRRLMTLAEMANVAAFMRPTMQAG